MALQAHNKHQQVTFQEIHCPTAPANYQTPLPISLANPVIHLALLMTIRAQVVHQITIHQAVQVIIYHQVQTQGDHPTAHHQVQTLGAALPVLSKSLDRNLGSKDPLPISF